MRVVGMYVLYVNNLTERQDGQQIEKLENDKDDCVADDDVQASLNSPISYSTASQAV